MTFVFLDSNIYRQLGQNFVENQDFKRLKDFLDGTYNEFGLLTVVKRELLDFYKKDIYDRLKKDYDKIKSNLESSAFIEAKGIPDLTAEIELGFQKSAEQFKIHKQIVGQELQSSNDLINFLLENKRVNGRKDNTRDYLIANDLIQFAISQEESQIVLITDDDFFTEHKHIQKVLAEKQIKNLHFFKTIPDFLKEFGPQFKFVNEEFVLSSVTEKEVKKELIKDIKCFPSYISGFYSDKDYAQTPDVKELTIKGIEVHDYYVTKNLAPDNYKIQFSLAISVKAVYNKDDNKEEFLKYKKNPLKKRNRFYQENYDEDGHLIFDHKVLFIYEGVVDTNDEKIKDIEFIDFFPDHFLWEEEKTKILEESKKEPIVQICQEGYHNFDEDNGFYRHSRYGGGLSWHYRCTKCGMLYDTGEYFD